MSSPLRPLPFVVSVWMHDRERPPVPPPPLPKLPACPFCFTHAVDVIRGVSLCLTCGKEVNR